MNTFVNVFPPQLPPFEPGAHLCYFGAERFYNDPLMREPIELRGKCGVVESVRYGWQGTGQIAGYENGEVIYDETHDSISIVIMEDGYRLTVDAKGAVDWQVTELAL